MNFKILSCLVSVIFLATFSLKAQEVEENIRMVKPFKADGIVDEWEKPLNQYNSATKLSFALANDDKNLYIIIESLDPKTTFSILRGGITLNINTLGKKKDGIKITFPLMERPPMPKDVEMKDGDRPPLNREQDGRISEPPVMKKNIKVSGFKNIKDGILSVINEDGIEAGMTISPNRELVYELSIPLAQLGVNPDLKNALAYNVKINQPDRPDFMKNGGAGGPGGRGGMGGGMGGMGGGGQMGGAGGGGQGGMGGGGQMGGKGGQRPPGEGGERPEDRKSDFWIKYKLVKT